ncbi:MAG: family 78 glycoside hydrolase catalytic domain [Clostridia bacterium]|nr:family 78 glycoside hydrolase catalytic domain [Clostridia bacterium]
MKAIRLKTEHLFDPIGIDIEHPRLSWNCEGGMKQTAYEIETRGWRSGKVETDLMHAVYPEKLVSRERVNWRIRLWDENGEPGEWSEAFFETGLLEPADWKAKWIAGAYSPNRKERYPADCFRRTFTIEKPVAEARLYASACGLYEAKLGGERVGEFRMAPGYTDYRKRVQYQTYDVTAMLHEGENELTVQLADGWYRGSCGAWGRRNQYGTETKLIMQLEIAYEDGTADIVCTDGGWEWSNDGPIRFADNKDGEIVEAFRTPLYLGRARETINSAVPTASNNVPVTAHETFRPAVTDAPNGRKLLDFGQNIAGGVRFRVNARLGQRMVWRFGEMLDADGNLTQKNIQLSNKKYTTPLQMIDFTCGEGVNEYETTFCVFGFRYAEVETDAELDPGNIESFAIYSDLERTGYFSSSDPLLDRLFEATVWSAKSNHLDIPTDCPTRERHGWTGDAQLFFTTAAYIFDFAPFARKYLHDVYDWQRKNGRLPHIAPDGGADFYMWTMNGSVGWSDAGVLIPWRWADIYKDDSILEEFYDGMARYARFMEKRCGRSMPFFAERVKLPKEAKRYFVNIGQSYGEWAEPADVDGGFRWQDFVAPHPEVSTAYTSVVLGLTADIAERLGHTSDAEEFRAFSEGCKAAYRELVSTGKYTLDTDRQARLVRPLYFGLLDDEQTEFAEKRLIKALDNYGWRLGTGFLSTPLILYVLASYDIEAAYRLLQNEEVPGWLSMPKAGATTIWEAWEGPSGAAGGIGSLNHYSKGAVCEWLFTTMCGIRVTGENLFTVAPRPGGRFTFASASYNSAFGLVSSRWERKDGMISYTVDVPANCTAEVRLPSGWNETVGAGTHVFTEEA